MKNRKDLIYKLLIISGAYIATFFLILGFFLYDTKEVESMYFFRVLVFLLFIPLLIKYFIHLMISPWYGLNQKFASKKSSYNYKPKVSVIVPAWNEEVGIVATMKSIVKNSYDNMELIVVNDGSTDNTDKVVKDYICEYDGCKQIKYFKKDNGGKSSAMNLGIKKAEGEIIVTTDADSIVDYRAIENMVSRFDDTRVMSVAGQVKVGNNQKMISDIQKLEYYYGFYFKRADSLFNSVYIVGGAAAAYRKEIFDKLGHFDKEIITEDIEYSTRILNAGYKIRYASDAIFYTEAPSDISGLIKQRLRWKYGRLMTFLKYKSLFFSLNRKQSRFLTHLVLPVALFAEFLLLFEVLLLPTFYIYTIVTKDFLPLILAVIFLMLIIMMQIVTEYTRKENRSILKFAPVAWIIFYFVDFVEYVALIKSLNKIFRKKKVEWQKWERKGVFGLVGAQGKR